jgi:hypothetical protein
MPISNGNRKILDLKRWEFCTPAPAATATGHFIVSSRHYRQQQLLVQSNTAAFLYNPAEDGWIQIPSPALAGTFGAGACGTAGSFSTGATAAASSLTATAGTTTSLTTNQNLQRDLRGYSVLIVGGSNAGRLKTIAANTLGANAVLTFTEAEAMAFDATTQYRLLTPTFFVLGAGTLAAGSFRRYDFATNSWVTLAHAGLPATIGTDGRLMATPAWIDNGFRSFASGTATGGSSTTLSNQPGILDPTTADLSHALPAGILFLDGSLEENDHRDDLGHPAAASLHQAWSRYGSAIASNRNLRDWLRLDFFKDVHKGMYENRPIHWPLSSSGKTFVVWVNIHRMDGRTLKELLAEHLIPARSRIDGELDDLRQVRDSEDRKAAREADSRIGKLSRWREELQEFIAAVEHCADHGAPPTDGRCPAREQDAVYAPDLDDGVMINSAALWPLLEPQWKDPKKWWKELASSQGKKDYDWAHLAMRYWPTRVDAKCQQDPSLGVAHGCFWLNHPERAWAWELRLQQEIGPDFRIEEAPYRPGGRDLGDQGDAPHRKAWLSEHPSKALAAVEKEAIRRMGRGDNRQVVNEMRLLEPGLWSVIPEEVSAMEQRLSDRQGSLFSLRSPDEAEGRAGTGEQTVQVGLALAMGGAEGAGA